MTNKPLIKYTGSKRYQAQAIVDLMPDEIDTYYECFVGGASVLRELLGRVRAGTKTVKRVVCCDINSDVIAMFNTFLKDSDGLLRYYTETHNEMLKTAGIDDDNRKEVMPDQMSLVTNFYYMKRDSFNAMPKDSAMRPYLLYWLLYHAYNGLIRYNKNGHYNVPFHVMGKRIGARPDYLKPIFDDWHELFDMFKDKIEFRCCDYREAIKDAKSGDLVYMDPPYQNLKGVYQYDTFDQKALFDEIDRLEDKDVKVMLSYDGISGDTDYTVDVPKSIYARHLYVNSARSAFKLYRQGSATESSGMVKDSLYLSW